MYVVPLGTGSVPRGPKTIFDHIIFILVKSFLEFLFLLNLSFLKVIYEIKVQLVTSNSQCNR